mmetsp:Transcript_11435/g.27793  ORF Transcript_11435/g.27793 Transcript_11435/m.27793 type:complete len:96 (-) Transcript_11435:346-633(-)
MRATAAVFLVGMLLVAHAAYSVHEERREADELDVPFDALPVELVVELLVGAVVATYGAAYVLAPLLPLSPRREFAARTMHQSLRTPGFASQRTRH